MFKIKLSNEGIKGWAGLLLVSGKDIEDSVGFFGSVSEKFA